jgi:type I restriction-modification system DNA methylase subunit
MSLFQHSVLNKYLNEANQDEMKTAYENLIDYFHNPAIQQNIRECKEEQFQEGFLRELFVKVLGYTINPDPGYNLTTEFKNEKGAKKADGAILIDSTAIGIIELKSTKTKELEAIRLQAFDYKANQAKCVYVITSNFEKVRFYINNAVEFEEFDLFRLEYEHFKLMWLCLAKDNLLKGIPLEIKEASLLKEEKVTKQIYVDYSLFKRDLYNDLTANNLELVIFNGKDEKEIKLTLFKKSQKLLDRFLFIFFGEDRGLLPPNSISEILRQWKQLKEMDEYKPLYERYKKYFNYLNKGWKGKKHEIFAYNGGLFIPDEILDNVYISDEVLEKHTKILTSYDFETEIDVNILGHIFENSLNEIEEKTAQIEGETVDLKKSKRKKDGIFYTPKYITKYIVENTAGKLCEEKKEELNIQESKFFGNFKLKKTKYIVEQKEIKTKKGSEIVTERRKTNISSEGIQLLEKLDVYRNWLLSLTICDPACGSGAFLNQALDFLINEHHYIDEHRAKILDVPLVLTEVENSILENNIYGVDINEESVEIAKLSLWLRTAQKGRKLTTLSSNIKCGNSLIDDPEIAGKKAFNWQNEFPEVFDKGGFDVVIGNPPYGRYSELKENEKKYLKQNNIYGTTSDLSEFFIRKVINDIIREEGNFSFIVPKGLTYVKSWSDIRRIFIEEKEIVSIMDTSKSFSDVLYEMVVFNIINKSPDTNIVKCGYFDNKNITTVRLKKIKLGVTFRRFHPIVVDLFY